MSTQSQRLAVFVVLASASFVHAQKAKEPAPLTPEQVFTAWGVLKGHGCLSAGYKPEGSERGYALSLVTTTTNDELNRLAPSLARLPFLRTLDLGHCRVGDEAIKAFKYLKLEAIFLNHTNVGDTGLKELSELPGLTWLDLSGTKVTDAGLVHLGGMKSLRVLRLADLQNVTDAGLKSLAALPSLQSLDLSGTSVELGEGIDFSGLKALRVVKLARTPLGDAGLKPLAKLGALGELDLGNTSVTGIGLKSMAGSANLRVLRLNGCPVTDEGAEGIAGLTALRELDLSNPAPKPVGKDKKEPPPVVRNRLSDAGLARLASCTELRKLILARTNMTGTAFKALAPLSKLIELDLEGTAVSDGAIDDLKNLKALRVLNLARTKLKGDGFKALAELENLQALNLEQVPFNNTNLVFLASASQLQDLNLRATSVTVAEVKALAPVSLARLDLSGVKINSAEVFKALNTNKSLRMLILDAANAADLAALQAVLPRCIVSPPERTIPEFPTVISPPRFPIE